MNNEDLCYLSVSDTLNLFKAGKLSPVELMKAIIKRTDKVEPIINAFTETFFDRAMDQAKMSEARYMKKGGRTRALDGIPLAIKDEVPVKGDPCTAGSLIFKGLIAEETAPFAQRLLNAGVGQALAFSEVN
jgi:Asp-tRNA(Asn)/Glu-tRNA(Gln) amidotransferase A subunit family amidase